MGLKRELGKALKVERDEHTRAVLLKLLAGSLTKYDLDTLDWLKRVPGGCSEDFAIYMGCSHSAACMQLKHMLILGLAQRKSTSPSEGRAVYAWTITEVGNAIS